MPRVSIIVPSYNHAPFLRAALDSVLAQDHADRELIVVDDGSTDDSISIVRSYGDRLRLIEQRGGRQARARNLALQVATGELVAFLDSDDRWLPRRLSAAVTAMAAHPQAGVVWSDFIYVDGQGRPLGEGRWQGAAAARPSADFARTLIAGNPICNGTVTVRRAALDAIGGFDERVPRVCDGAAWYQIAARGHGFVHLPQRLLEYRLHGRNDSGRFAPMTRDRDTALVAAAQAYLSHGALAPTERPWLRDALARQFAFRAAAWVQRDLGDGAPGALRAALYDALGSDAGLRGFAWLQGVKSTLLRREHPT
jgi:glycosyltransferase involved in cell wall biosynthesis